MSVHITDEALIHSWNATPEPSVGRPTESVGFREAGSAAYLMNKESPREFIVCQKDKLMKVRR